MLKAYRWRGEFSRMTQRVFNLLTWGVVGVAVLSSLWLVSQVPVADLRAAKVLQHEGALMSLPSEPTAAGPQASAAAASGRSDKR